MRTIYGVAATIVVLDQTTKFFAIRFLKSLDSVPILPRIFHLSYVENTGIAFGLFQDFPAIWTFAIAASLVVLMICARFFVQRRLIQQVAYGFILGGAIGNWIDRVRLQSVIDFLDFRIWPVFNLADSFITVGVILFIWFSLKGERTCTRSFFL